MTCLPRSTILRASLLPPSPELVSSGTGEAPVRSIVTIHQTGISSPSKMYLGERRLLMDTWIQHWIDLWDYLDGNFWAVHRWAQSALNEEAVAWQPIPQVASIGWNLQHLGEMLDYYLAHFFGHREQISPSSLVTMQSGSQDDGRFRDLAAIGAYHRKVRPAYREFLSGMTNKQLTRIVERTGRRDVTYAWAVGHIAEHESYHIGKCMLLRSLLLARGLARH